MYYRANYPGESNLLFCFNNEDLSDIPTLKVKAILKCDYMPENDEIWYSFFDKYFTELIYHQERPEMLVPKELIMTNLPFTAPSHLDSWAAFVFRDNKFHMIVPVLNRFDPFGPKGKHSSFKKYGVNVVAELQKINEVRIKICIR